MLCVGLSCEEELVVVWEVECEVLLVVFGYKNVKK